MTEPTGTEKTIDDLPRVPDYPPSSGAAPGAVPVRRRSPLRTLGMALLVALLGFGGGVAGYLVTDQAQDDGGGTRETSFQPTNEEPDSSSAVTGGSGGGLTPREIYREVAPGVVHIESRVTSDEESFFGLGEPETETGTGSGFIIDDEGHIVTNAHVVEGADELSVSFGTDAKVPAKLVGEDRSSDIAVIKIDLDADELDGVETRILDFGDSTRLQVGDPVLAIGNPFGLDRTLTTGVVSALQREIPALNDFQINDVIQTDAAVNPGNSGGPLLNSRGAVIGVNSQIQSRSGVFAGIAFAVPSSRVERVAEQLIDTGSVRYAWLGVAGGSITPELVEEYDLTVDEGVLVGTVTPGSPADKAGIEGGREVRGSEDARPVGGDVIVSFDGEQLDSMVQLAGLVDAHKPGDKVKVEFIQDGREKTTTVTLGNRPDDVDGASDEE